MKLLFALLLAVAAPCCRADEASDRAAIDKVVSALNDPAQRSAIFASDVNAAAELARLARTAGPDRPWSETSPPLISPRAVHFITADVALVDAVSARYGSVIPVRSVPVLAVVKREGGGWKIAALRATAPLSWGRDQ